MSVCFCVCLHMRPTSARAWYIYFQALLPIAGIFLNSHQQLSFAAGKPPLPWVCLDLECLYLSVTPPVATSIKGSCAGWSSQSSANPEPG